MRKDKGSTKESKPGVVDELEIKFNKGKQAEFSKGNYGNNKKTLSLHRLH